MPRCGGSAVVSVFASSINHLTMFGIGDKHLGTVDDVRIALPDSRGAHRRGIRASIRLGQHQSTVMFAAGKGRYIGTLCALVPYQQVIKAIMR